MAKQSDIEKLLTYDGLDVYSDAEEVEDIERLLYLTKAEEIQQEFREGSRWSNYRETIHKVVADEPDGRVFFFKTVEEIPATEMQDGGEFTFEFDEVHEHTETIKVYR